MSDDLFKLKRDRNAEMCAEYFYLLFEPLRHVARRCGYALAVHGTIARDIDLLAAPWRESCVEPEYLIEQIRKATEAVIGFARVRDVDKDRTPAKQPCGRLAWSFYLTHDDEGPYLDVSVMPFVRRKEKPEAESTV